MKDFTQIQIEPIPPSISELQKANGALKGQNELLKNIIIVSSVVAVGILAYYIIKKQKEEEEGKTSDEETIKIITK